jgi:hypothetical protein
MLAMSLLSKWAASGGTSDSHIYGLAAADSSTVGAKNTHRGNEGGALNDVPAAGVQIEGAQSRAKVEKRFGSKI